MIIQSAFRKSLQSQFIAKWNECPDQFPESKRQFNYLEKRIWEIKFNHFLRLIKKEFRTEKPDKTKILDRSKSFFEENLAYSKDQMQLIFSEDMLEATKDFIRKAWTFDSELSFEDIFQALRNLWIMLGLQSFFGKEIQTTPSLMAYSLLYPYTDNLIDSATINQNEKLDFCTRFALRLTGEQVAAKSQIESRIFDLVSLIESEFERQTYPEVYESLLAIHHAQTDSLKLVKPKSELSDAETFLIAIEKGATSVIADGYLVLGNLNEKEYHFLYEYGAYLQILDDLQDARDDFKEGIMTHFSKNLQHAKLDQLLCKTYYLGKSFYQDIKDWYPNELSFQGLIQRSFGFLILASVFQNQDDFSDHFIQTAERHAPFRFSFIQSKQTEMEPFRQHLIKMAEAYKTKEFVV